MLLVLVATGLLSAQEPFVNSGGPTLPSSCAGAQTFVKTSDPIGFYFCGNGAWQSVSGGEGIPSGANIFIDSGACPAGYTENAALSGKTLIGTTAAAGNVGTTGGSDTITPAGSISQPTASWPAQVPTHSGTAASFSGNALGTHAHELPLHGGSTPRITAGYGTGASIAGTRALTNTAQTTSQAVLLSQAVSAGTPSGTVTITNQGAIAWPVNTPSVTAPTFTGQAGDNRSSFIRVIVCKKS